MKFVPGYCVSGKSRAGVYCAANVAIEQVIEHGEIDVFQAVRTVRRHRVQLVENMVSNLNDFKTNYSLLRFSARVLRCNGSIMH